LVFDYYTQDRFYIKKKKISTLMTSKDSSALFPDHQEYLDGATDFFHRGVNVDGSGFNCGTGTSRVS